MAAFRLSRDIPVRRGVAPNAKTGQAAFLRRVFWYNVASEIAAFNLFFEQFALFAVGARRTWRLAVASISGGAMSVTKIDRQPGRTVTRADLSEVVYHRVGLSRTESAELVQAVLDEICDAAARGETVKLSSFGSFVVRSKGQRIGRNPKTGVEVPILPRRVMVFKPSNVLKARVNGLEPDKGEQD